MKKLFCLLITFLMLGCSSRAPMLDRGSYYAETSFPSKSQDERIKFIILHYTVTDDKDSLDILTRGEVSANYLVLTQPKLIDEKPVVLQLVPERKRAFHAGQSHWRNRTNINDTSIGIEIVNPGFTEDTLGNQTWYRFGEGQIAAVASLVKDLMQRYQIKPEYVLGHSDIAPLRKTDPGRLFPWKQLASQGIGVWPNDELVAKYLAGRSAKDQTDVLSIQNALYTYGYSEIPQTGELDEETRLTISAFQAHFRPSDVSGNADAETESIALALVEQYRPSK